MARHDLYVPFREKDAAKQLGARWDAASRVWYVPEGIDTRPFSRWFPIHSDVNVKATSYYIAQTSKTCWECTEQTRLFGFLLPAGTEILEPCDGVDGDYVWVLSEYPFFVQYVTNITNANIARMTAHTSSYCLDYSKPTQKSYWMNHCDHCCAKQGDFQIYSEPQGGFLLIREQDATKITLHPVNEAFVCNGDYGCDVEFFDLLQKD